MSRSCNRCEADAGTWELHNVLCPTWRQMNVRAVYPKSLCNLPAVVTGGCVMRSRRPSTTPTTTKARLATARALCNWNHQPFLFLKRAIRMAAGMSKPHVLPMTVACFCTPCCTVTCRVTEICNLTEQHRMMQGMFLCCKHKGEARKSKHQVRKQSMTACQQCVQGPTDLQKWYGIVSRGLSYRKVGIVCEVLGPEACSILWRPLT